MYNIWNSPEYLKDIFDYKSKRRSFLLKSINEFYNIDNDKLRLIGEAFECLHFSVTTVDDIFDNVFISLLLLFGLVVIIC